MRPNRRHVGGLARSSDIGSQTAGVVLAVLAIGQGWLMVTGGTVPPMV